MTDQVHKQSSVPVQYLRLIRPANVVTAYADIIAGWSVTAAAPAANLLLLCATTTGLYAGGVVFNDVFDAKLDAVERPERPIPSGAISLAAAAVFGGILLTLGILAAWFVSGESAGIAIATAAFALLYNAAGKRDALLGPLNMGLCRGLNLLLGISAVQHAPGDKWIVASVTLCYIAGITSLSRGEVRGGTRMGSAMAMLWLTAAAAIFAALSIREGHRAIFALPFVAVLLLWIAAPLIQALRSAEPMAIRVAVKAGVLSLIVVDSCIAALYAGPWYGAAILLLYIPALLLAKIFAVT